ncbi:uncharacterized protein LOC129592000 [Paramacrobiotus metropolitanus]|uniref:uncharacterized protein LOC129592000 n=1 Tax=Paramacrobiotus metropolitanus TaxID=2943436 RepID=UPI0024462D15|nr:uncharacterized protein LOC129592000 [Paramacrobiotus metropolitanus]
MEADRYTGSNDQLQKQDSTNPGSNVNAEEHNDHLLNFEKSVLEGDILVAPHQWNNSSLKVAKWPNGIIPFMIDPKAEFSRHERILIHDAMLEFHQFTCIRFVLRTTQKDYLHISSNSRRGCASFVGKIGGEQKMHLESSKCVQVSGTILHQLMHTLGFLHEHSRADRDTYVDVDWNHVACIADDRSCGITANTLSDSPESANSPYDYDSIMHYSSTAFSKDAAAGLATIIPRHTSSARIGQRKQLSSGDIAKVNSAYNCQANLKVSTKFVDRLVPEKPLEQVFSQMQEYSQAKDNNLLCQGSLDFMPTFGLKTKNSIYIGNGNKIWEVVEGVYNGSTVFFPKNVASDTIQKRFHELLPKDIDSAAEINSDVYFFKNASVWILSGQGDKQLLDTAPVSQVFPGVPLPIKGVFKSSNILSFSNGSSIVRYDLISDRLQPKTPFNLLNQHTGWPTEVNSFFDIGRNRLLIFTHNKVYLTKQNGFPMDYGYPKTFKETFCTA